jgi:RNA polymerase sigma factor (sigma-70 family)
MESEARPEAESLDLFIANQPRFLAFLRRHVRDEAEAEDLLQQAMLKAIRRQGDWDGKENILAWFYRILRNALIDHYRSRAGNLRKAEALAAAPPSGLPQEDRERLCACFHELLPSLKPEYSEVLRRVDLGEEDPTQVAASLGVTPNNLFVRLHRARQSLRKSLEKTCGVCTRHGCLDCTCNHGTYGHHKANLPAI